MTVTPENDLRVYRQALGCFATGVAVVTALSEDRPVGMTINSLASVSLRPPLILWSIDEQATHYEAFSGSDYFAVHILSAAQRSLSDFFSAKMVDKFANRHDERDAQGLPLLEDCVARFECALEATHRAGDHNIILGRVLRYQSNPTQAPLLFAGGRHHQLGEPLDAKDG